MLALLCPFPKLVTRIPGLGPALFQLFAIMHYLQEFATRDNRFGATADTHAPICRRKPPAAAPLPAIPRSTLLRVSPLRLRRAHLRHAFLELPRHMRHDTELPLDKHHLRPVMHFVFFSTQQPFEPRFSPFFRPPPLLSPPEIPVSAFPTTPRTARLRFSADSRFPPWTWA